MAFTRTKIPYMHKVNFESKGKTLPLYSMVTHQLVLFFVCHISMHAKGEVKKKLILQEA